MAETKEYTGTIQEISQTSSSDRAPRKVMISDGGEFAKTFRCWPFKEKDTDELDRNFKALTEALHKEVTVYYQEIPKKSEDGSNSWTENKIVSVGAPPKGYQSSAQGNGHLTEDNIRWIVRDELAKANVYSSFPGTEDVTPDYQSFKDTAAWEGTNENGLEKRWAKFHSGDERTWSHATQEELVEFASVLGFTWPVVKEGAA